MEKKTFGEFLASLRKEKGMTQAELAEVMNVSDKTVSHWERGESSPDLEALPKIARIFSVTCDELLSGERKQEAETLRFDVPPPAPKAKNSEHVIKKILDGFKIKTLILLGIDAAGVLFGFIAVALIPMPVIGLAVACVFFAAALILSFIFRASALGKGELDALSDEKRTQYRQAVNFHCFISVMFTVLFVCFAVPLGSVIFPVSDRIKSMFLYLALYGGISLVIFAIIYLILRGNGTLPKRLKSGRTEKQRKMLTLSVSVISVTAVIVAAFAVWSYSVVNTDVPTTGFERTFGSFEEFKAFMEEDVPKNGEVEATVLGQEPFEKRVVDGREFVWRNKSVFNYYSDKDADGNYIYCAFGTEDSPRRKKLVQQQSFVIDMGWTVYFGAAVLALGAFGIGSRKIRKKYD